MTDAPAKFPRVTAILDEVGLGADYSMVHPATLEAARIRGTAVHAAIEADVYGIGNDALLSEDVLARVTAYRAFLKDSNYQPIAAELEVVNTAWRYRGHPDSIGWLLARRVILDWKAIDHFVLGVLASAALQLTAYRCAWNASRPHEPVDGLAVVQLRGDGMYRVHEIDPTIHERVWFAAVTVYHARRERR